MTYWSRTSRISRGLGRWLRAACAFSSSSSRMMSLHSSTHSSQMNTLGPAISLRTSCWLLPQKEQYRILPLSPERPWRSSVMLVAWVVWVGAEDSTGRQAAIPTPAGAGAGLERPPGPASAGLDGLGRAGGQHVVDDAVLAGLLGRHEVVTLDVALDLFQRLAGVGGQFLVQALAQVEDFLGLDGDVAGLALGAARGLVDHHPAVGQDVALALGSGRQQEGSHRAGLADADGADVGLDEAHGVVDRQAGGDDAAGRVDVQADVLLGVLRLEEQQLRHHHVGHVVVDRANQEHHPLLEQARVDVVGALAAAGLLDH